MQVIFFREHDLNKTLTADLRTIFNTYAIFYYYLYMNKIISSTSAISIFHQLGPSFLELNFESVLLHLLWLMRGYKQGQNIKDGSMDNTWNIRRLVDESFVPSAQQTSILYCRLTDFWITFCLLKLIFIKYSHIRRESPTKPMCVTFKCHASKIVKVKCAAHSFVILSFYRISHDDLTEKWKIFYHNKI